MAANDQNRGTLLCILHALMRITPIATYLFNSSLVDIKAVVSDLTKRCHALLMRMSRHREKLRQTRTSVIRVAASLLTDA